ncbi:GIY-YIG nuclease family protein (plasmid) [Bosea sp. F3-2]|uniref:GIY-YIG nuclease family protein n=1 Tax=Bosea sp. F3-2 TaxID=2599640 RepID=UPI0011EE4438|nr:GIY-YIG nuclease family protein [Bosea sp. F3-2]QEL27248.1 GIY-YIG nuclease family protein [Bosea sp. F3-2]
MKTAPAFDDPFRRIKSVQVTLESHDPLGPSVRRLGNSDAIGITFPRDALRRVAEWPELSRRGVYMLIAPDAGDRAMRIYVGEAQNLLTRLSSHERDRHYPRYVQIAIVVSTDNQLREDIAQYIEQRLIQALIQTGMVEVENKPPAYPDLPLDVRAVAENFFRDALLLLSPIEPMTGMACATILQQERLGDFLKDDPAPPPAGIASSVVYELRREHCHALAVKAEDRTMRILAGARIAGEIHFSLPKRGRELRARLIAAGTLVREPYGEAFVLLQDVSVFSYRGAADLVTGRKSDGYHSWKLANFNLGDGEET